MTYQDLKDNKNKHVATNNKEVAIKYLEKMVPLCSDLAELHDLMLELKDLSFDTENIENAGKIYNEFINLYPGSPKTEYAYYKAITCSFKQIYDAERDQSKTKETIELAEAFLKRPLFTAYQEQVRMIYTQCQEQLLASELNVFNFYVGRGRMVSAQKRLELIRATYIPVLPSAEARILACECHIAQEQNKMDLVEQKKKELTEKFPDFAQQMAESNQPVHKFAYRF